MNCRELGISPDKHVVDVPTSTGTKKVVVDFSMNQQPRYNHPTTLDCAVKSIATEATTSAGGNAHGSVVCGRENCGAYVYCSSFLVGED